MDKRLIGYTIAFFMLYFLAAQDFDTFNQDRLDINKKGMLVLSSWALANIISSPIMAARTSGSNKYFHQMNGYWNGINLIIGGFGFYSAITGDAVGLSLTETLKEQQSIEKILLLNTGLDVAYMTTGLFLNERGKLKGNNRLKGFGKSMILQGGFLFAFDLVFYFVHSEHSGQLNQLLNQLTLNVDGIGLIWKL